MTGRGLVLTAGAAAIVVGVAIAQDTRPAAALVLPPSEAMPASLARAIDPVIDASWTAFDAVAAQGHVEAIGPTWRLAGNASYDAALDRVRDRLAASGFPAANLRFDENPASGRGWEHTVGTLAVVGGAGRADQVVLSRERHRVALAINSFPTPAGGTVARIVDVGPGASDADFANRDLKGAVVLGDAAIGRLWQRAVVAGGAIGVVSTSMADYITPDAPGAAPTPRDEWDILQWGSVPFDEARKAFGFKASPRAASALRGAIAAAPGGAVEVRVTIESTFTGRPARMLIAEIPGSIAPDERVVMAAHVQEPGAGDNASGVATLAELAHHQPASSIGLVVDLMPAADIPRMPTVAACTIDGVIVPCIAVDAGQPSAAARVRLAVRGLRENLRVAP
jgi:hypothetical protein